MGFYGVYFDLRRPNGECPIDPDIAGIGVVFSFVITGVLVTLSSVYATVLDAKIKDPKALLPSRVNAWLCSGVAKDAARRFRLHRKVLEKLIQAFTDQQLVTGISLLLSGYIKYGFYGYGPRNAHFTLGLFLSCLSSSSHLAGVITLRRYLNHHPTTARLRVFLIICFALLLAVSMFVTNPLMPFYIPLLWAGPVGLPPMLCIIYVFWMAVMQCMDGWRQKLQSQIRRLWPLAWRRKLSRIFRAFVWFCLIGHPFEVFIIQILFAVISLYFVLAQKFAPTPDPQFCSLNNADENLWGFGQTLPMFLLLQPLVTALETYLEQRDEETTDSSSAASNNQASTSTPASLCDSPATPRTPKRPQVTQHELRIWPPPRYPADKANWETEDSPISDYDQTGPYNFSGGRAADAEMSVGTTTPAQKTPNTASGCSTAEATDIEDSITVSRSGTAVVGEEGGRTAAEIMLDVRRGFEGLDRSKVRAPKQVGLPFQ